jgi:cell division protein FtsB
MTSTVVLSNSKSRSYNKANSRFNEVSRVIRNDTSIPLNVTGILVYDELDDIADDNLRLKIYPDTHIAQIQGSQSYISTLIIGNSGTQSSSFIHSCVFEIDTAINSPCISFTVDSSSTYNAIIDAVSKSSLYMKLIQRIISEVLIPSGGPSRRDSKGLCEAQPLSDADVTHNISIVKAMEYPTFVSTMTTIAPNIASIGGTISKVTSILDTTLLDAINILNQLSTTMNMSITDLIRRLKDFSDLLKKLEASKAEVKKLEAKNTKLRTKYDELKSKSKAKGKNKKGFGLFNKKSENENASAPGTPTLGSVSAKDISF